MAQERSLAVFPRVCLESCLDIKFALNEIDVSHWTVFPVTQWTLAAEWEKIRAQRPSQFSIF
jgi:hypothetical protein